MQEKVNAYIFLLRKPPTVVSKGIANPIATIRAAGMLIEYLTQSSKVSNSLERAIYDNLKNGPRTPDLGGKSTTTEVAMDILERTKKLL